MTHYYSPCKALILALFMFAFARLEALPEVKYDADSLLTVLAKTTDKVKRRLLFDTLENGNLSSRYSTLEDESKFFEKFLSLAIEFKVDTAVCSDYFYLGSLFSSMGNFDQALEMEMKALEIAQRISSDQYKYLAYKETGTIYNMLDNPTEALNYFKKTEALMSAPKIAGNNLLISRIYSHMTYSFLALNQTDSALHYAQSANERIDSTDTVGRARIPHLFALIYLQKGDTLLAMDYFKKGIAIGAGGKWFVIKGEYTLCVLDYSKLLFSLHDFNSAKYYALCGYKLSIENGQKSDIVALARQLSAVYKATGQKDSAYYYTDIMTAYTDSVYNQQKITAVQNMHTMQKIKEQEDAVLEAGISANHHHKIQLGGVSIGLLVFLMMFLLLSNTFLVGPKTIEMLGTLSLLLVFEFAYLLIHPALERYTNDSPIWMLLAMAAIAGVLVPVHHRIEHRVTHILVERNNKIRLTQAVKTVQELQGDKPL